MLKSRRSPNLVLQDLVLDRNGTVSLQQQIYRYFFEAIHTGRIGDGQKLPSTRQLGDDLGVSRMTVIRAYDELAAGGLIVSEQGTGVFANLPKPLARRESFASDEGGLDCGEEFREFSPRVNNDWEPFAPDYPYVYDATVKKILGYERLELDRLGQISETADVFGAYQLRQAISFHLLESRGVSIDPRNIIVSSDVMLCTGANLRATGGFSKTILVVEPGTMGLCKQLEMWNIGFERTSIFDPRLNDIDFSRYAAVFVGAWTENVPVYNLFSGRGAEDVIARICESGTYIVYCDTMTDGFHTPNGAAQMFGKLMACDDRALVSTTFYSHFGSFRRLCYLVIPDRFVDLYRKILTDVCISDVPTAFQYGVTRFIQDGFLGKHLRIKRHFHRAQHEAFAALMADALDGLVKLDKSGCSLAEILWLPHHVDVPQLCNALRSKRILAAALSSSFSHYAGRPALRLGFNRLGPNELEKPTRLLASEIIRALGARRPVAVR